MAPGSRDPCEQIYDLVKGRSVRLPDLQAMMVHWPAAVNPHLELLKKATVARLEWLFPGKQSKGRRQKMH
jgi:hypothetical protein